MEQAILQASIIHELVDQYHTASLLIGGESDGGDDVIRIQFSSKREFVLVLALALERANVHDFDGEVFARVFEGSAVDGAGAAVAEAAGGGEGGGGAAEGGVREAVRGFGIGNDGALFGEFAEAEGEEEEDGEGGGDAAGDGKEEGVVRRRRRQLWRKLARGHGGGGGGGGGDENFGGLVD